MNPGDRTRAFLLTLWWGGAWLAARLVRTARHLAAAGRHVVLFSGYCLFVLARFVVDWVGSRPVRPLLWGMPAVSVAGAVLGALIVARAHARYGLAREYLQAVYQASRSGDWRAADLYLARLEWLRVSDPEIVFNMALLAEQRKDHERARQLMQRIAPADQTGYARAHYWLAVDLAKNRSPLNLEHQRLLEHHLQANLGRQPSNVPAHAMLAQLYLKQKRFPDAIPHLLVAAAKLPSLQIVLAQSYAVIGQPDRAREVAEQARDYYRRRLENDPKNASYRVMLARIELFLQNAEQAEKVLLEGLREAIATGEPDEKVVRQFRQALSLVYVTRFDEVSQAAPEELGQRIRLLQQALQYGPDNPRALDRLAQLATLGEDDAEAARQQLKQVLAEGQAPPTVHLIVGTSLLEKGESEQAIQHLELAFEQMPRMPVVANNLAWALAFRDSPDLARAERLANIAIRLAPQHPEIRETRGMILAKRGKTKEAIADLELALQSFPDRRRIHERLAELYEHIGDADLAKQHRALASRSPPTRGP